MTYIKKIGCFFILLVFTIIMNEAAECGQKPTCNEYAKIYRTMDGSCNNLNNSLLGRANTPYSRLLPAKFADGISQIANSVAGGPLPNARFLSEQFFRELPSSARQITTLIIGILQFMAHDLSFTKLDVSDKKCCSAFFQTRPNEPSGCRNIVVPPNDPVYSEYDVNCLPVSKTQSNYDIGCPPTQSKQAELITSETHWLDLSVIYDNSDTAHKRLRTFSGGLLKMDNRNGQQYLPNSTDQSSCVIPKNNYEVCYMTGNSRANANTHLVLHTTTWVRTHNNVARYLQELNPCWNDEKVFQETRKIVTAEFQWITYNEIMPIILGKKYMLKNKLIYTQEGYINDYDSKCDPSVINEMAHAAFRSLHTFIRKGLDLADETRAVYDSIILRDHMERPQVIESFHNFDALLRGMSVQMTHLISPFHDKEITQQFLMRKSRIGSDLKSIDIHRARLHGLPSYNDMRSYCGLKKAKTFNDFSDAIDLKWITKLQSIYKHPDDVDLTVGGQLERPRGDALIGPTFACIFVKQLRVTRKCDRFWFENKEAGLTLEQLKEIKKQTMATFICEISAHIRVMQHHAFLSLSEHNKLQHCSTLPRWNLQKWKDPKCDK